jgi:hypothetical protein
MQKRVSFNLKDIEAVNVDPDKNEVQFHAPNGMIIRKYVRPEKMRRVEDALYDVKRTGDAHRFFDIVEWAEDKEKNAELAAARVKDDKKWRALVRDAKYERDVPPEAFYEIARKIADEQVKHGKMTRFEADTLLDELVRLYDEA